jgi:hypothetical protein
MTVTPASGPWRLLGLRRGVSITRAQGSDFAVLVQVDARKCNCPSHCAAFRAQCLMQTVQRGRLLLRMASGCSELIPERSCTVGIS